MANPFLTATPNPFLSGSSNGPLAPPMPIDLGRTQTSTIPIATPKTPNITPLSVAKSVAQGTGEFALSAGEAIPRLASNQVATSVQPPTLIPGTLGKFIGPLQSIQSQFNEANQKGDASLFGTALQTFTDEPLGIAFKPLFLGLGMLSKTFSKDLVQTLVKATDPAEVVTHLATTFPDIPKPFFEKIAPDIAETTDPARIQQIVGDATKQYVDESTGKMVDAAAAQHNDLVDQYLKANDNYISADNARELFPQYAADRSLSGEVHEQASAVSKDAYKRLLDERPGMGNNTVLFTAGGTGAGKTSAISKLRDAKAYPIIYDSNVTTAATAIPKVDAALDKGFKVEMTYVHNDIHGSLDNAMSRASKMEKELGSGRTVPLDAHLTTHTEAPKTYIELAKHYADDPRVNFKAIDNSVHNTPVEQSDPLAFMGKVRYNDSNETLRENLTKQVARAHADGSISDRTRAGFLGREESSKAGTRPGASNSARDGGGASPTKSRAKEYVAPEFKESGSLIRQRETPPLGKSTGEVDSAAAKADQSLAKADTGAGQKGSSLIDIVQQNYAASVKDKINIIDYLRTPDRVLQKIGFGHQAKMLEQAYDGYIRELPKNIDHISAWAKQVPKDADGKIFRYLDGKEVSLTDTERKVAIEIQDWLKGWADRLQLPEDKRITNYITHIFDKELLAKEFDEDLAKIITDKLPGSVYDPFLLKRLGAKGYKESVWQALDAYVKRATRKVYMDPVLDSIQAKAGTSLEMAKVETSQFKFLQRYVSNINMRPTELDNLLDNSIKSLVGYKYGDRPVTYLTKTLRQMTYRGMLGINPGSALRNLSQGINTYAVLGEKYTAIGYLKLFNQGSMKELAEQGVLQPGFIQDRTLSSTRKAIEKVDKGLFSFFEGTERINRGAAYFGAKSKALKAGKSEEAAIEYAKAVVRKTQFQFGSVHTPVALQSDIAKTLAQFQTYTLKQTEFLAEMAKDKNFIGLVRYGVAGLAFVYTVGKAFGMQPQELIPSFRFDTPPSLKVPTTVAGAVLNTPDQYNRPRSLAQKAKDIAGAAVGLIPAGNQIKKSIQGAQAYSQGKDVTASGKTRYTIPHTPGNAARSILFGKNSLPQAKAYFNKTSTKPAAASTNPFLR